MKTLLTVVIFFGLKLYELLYSIIKFLFIIIKFIFVVLLVCACFFLFMYFIGHLYYFLPTDVFINFYCVNFETANGTVLEIFLNGLLLFLVTGFTLVISPLVGMVIYDFIRYKVSYLIEDNWRKAKSITNSLLSKDAK